MIPSTPVLVQQQTSSGVQLILRSPPPAPAAKQSTVVLSNGSLAQPGTVLVQGRQQPQYVRLLSGQMLQLQQIQTSSGPTIIAVPAPSTPTPPPQPPPSPTLIKKVKKKKKKEEEPTRLDLANLMKLSGIEDEDVAPVSVAQQTQTPPQQSPTPPPPPQQQLQHQPPPPASPKQQQASHLVAQLQAPTQMVGLFMISSTNSSTSNTPTFILQEEWSVHHYRRLTSSLAESFQCSRICTMSLLLAAIL
ncbi:GLTSCR protein [Homalodisca vitripennis]|nr:GLTSCR protein [Homalodisca vitripennis]